MAKYDEEVACDKAIDDLSEGISNLVKELKDRDYQIILLQNRIDDLEQTVEDLEEDLKSANTELEELQEEVDNPAYPPYD